MYSGNDEMFVELGYVAKGLSASGEMRPDRSKAGGLPAWFEKSPVAPDPVCRLCGRALFLVTQVYAPTHVPRSICVFGCNRAACSRRPEGWRAIRTQQPHVIDGDPAANRVGPPAPKASNLTSPAPVCKCDDMKPASQAWGAHVVTWDDFGGADDWGDDTSDWAVVDGADGGLKEGETVSIGELLDKRDVLSADKMSARAADHKPAPRQGATAKRVEEIEGGRSRHSPHSLSAKGRPRSFPAQALNFSPEPWDYQGARADLEMEERIERYREQEEDRGLLAALDEALLSSGGDKSKINGSRGGARALDVGERYERTPARAKAVLRFAERVSRSPQQVLRYAYGGEPIWSASDPPQRRMPLCTCGATRVFEMQLMPSLLLKLQVNDFVDVEDEEEVVNENSRHDEDGKAMRSPLVPAVEASSSSIPFKERSKGMLCDDPDQSDGAVHEEEGSNFLQTIPEPTDDERKRLRTPGMDWGVVAVWSCPESCELSSEEEVVVQLPV